ncbi:UDP-2,3-diacylglucosamine diphosphatase [Abyssibacter sp.]|uniref:UDP-2,3-diacylglucosamine diphosphatase n=1 Tax=Abyssibacter sp. TaxID=2320200 RepID=UPI000C68CAF6|nr:UDP-2,3-diacylglucosamine diphosphatase [Abyssibacter sp.]MBB86654.1 UDP-2,3-diacylglucosamine diphosphatase [Xanthomonadales bacterium]MBB87091.1 UDP-2,3-diacylglucosamine diphosphatase [Xanthomonadales bacterium]MCK5858372.1 UDP-2,3-diacylglucosamine diphosphatase [Abyssibacter sp.]
MIHLLSDLHLAPGDGLTRRFVEYLAGPARDADAIYILGDLFNVWLGDDLSMPEHAEAVDAIAAATQAGVTIYVMHGNRDFLLGRVFAEATGVTLLSDPWVGELAGVPTLLTHGDRFCTQDRGYQTYRSIVRSVAVQRAYYGMPQRWRERIADRLRKRSRGGTPMKALNITDVDAKALYAAARTEQVQRIFHGHTHRPAIHRIGRRKQVLERYVLEDWSVETGGSVITLAADGTIRSLPIEAPAAT